MDRRPSLLERAFELARQGASISEIRVKLRAEGYDRVEEQTRGLSLKRQLRAAGASPVKRGERTSKPYADEWPQPMHWRVGSDDGGHTWRELQPDEAAGLVSTHLGPPEGWQDEWSGARTLAEAIDRARADKGR